MLTAESFLAFYPQFSPYARSVVLSEYLRQANARFADFGADAEEARRLLVAHRLTMHAASSLPEGAESSQAALAEAARSALQTIVSRRVGEVSVSYAGILASSASAGFRELQATPFGLQLLSLLKQYGFSRYLP